jgi:hypothetical protein
LTLIQELYRIEKTIKDLPVTEKLQIRQQQATTGKAYTH